METKEAVESRPVREKRTGKTRRRYRFEEKLKAVRLLSPLLKYIPIAALAA